MILQEGFGQTPRCMRVERRLTAAFGVSVLLHVLVLLPASWTIPARTIAQIAQPLVATFRAQGDQAPAAPSRERAIPDRQAADTAPSAARYLVAREPVVARAREAVGNPDPGHAAPRSDVTGAPRADGSDGPRRAAVQNTAMTAPNAAPPERENEGLDAEAVRQYRFGLARAVTKRYPRQAIVRGWTGTAEVRVTVAREGLTREVVLNRSSGHPLLDAEAGVGDVVVGVHHREPGPRYVVLRRHQLGARLIIVKQQCVTHCESPLSVVCLQEVERVSHRHVGDRHTRQA